MSSSTDDRDAELDGLNEELEDGPKHIHQPDDMDIGDGTMCFLNVERKCGADCTAFNWEIERGRRTAPNQCVILYHLGALGSGAIGHIHSLNLKKREQQDRERKAAADQKVPSI